MKKKKQIKLKTNIAYISLSFEFECPFLELDIVKFLSEQIEILYKN